MQIIPAILTSNVQELDSLLRQIRDSQKFERVQIDFIDGKYANSLTIKPQDVDTIPYLPLKYDAHLMVVEDNILFYSKAAEKIGFDRVIAQMESISRPQDFSCLALDLETPIEKIEPYLKKLDLVVLLSVRAGQGGQEFDKRVLDKIKKIAGRGVRICVDGGVEKEQLPLLENLRVDEVAVGAKRVLSW